MELEGKDFYHDPSQIVECPKARKYCMNLLKTRRFFMLDKDMVPYPIFIIGSDAAC